MKLKELKLLSEKPQRLSVADAKREACSLCSLHKACVTPYFKPWVPTRWTGRLLAIGESPDTPDNPAGTILKNAWHEAGYEDEDVALVYAVRCRPRKFVKPNMTQIRACRPFLLRVIEELKPKLIITFGGAALKALTNDGRMENVTENRGRPIIVKGVDSRIYATYSPFSVLHGNLHHRERIIEDLRRASWPRMRWPKRERCTGKLLGFDTEFIEPSPTLDPKTDSRATFCVAVSDGRSAYSYEPHDLALKKLFQTVQKLAPHNGPCDVDSLVQLGICKETWARGEDIRDSLWLSRLADENRGKGGYKLENLFLSRHNTKPWKAKTEAYGFDPRKWPPELMHERCRLDAWASYHLSNDFLKEARGQLTLQHRIGLTLQRILHTGVYVDTKFLNKFKKKTDATLVETAKDLKRKAKRLGFKDFEPGNKNHIRALVYDGLKIEPTQFTGKGLPSVEKLVLKQYKDDYPEVALALTYGKHSKIKQTYIEATGLLLRDAHTARVNDIPVRWMPVRINPLGARTLRRSSGSDPFETTEENGLNFQNWPKEIRPLITTRFTDGLIVDNDYHKLEAILQGWLSGEEAMVDYFLNSPNGYIEIGTRLFGKTVEEDTTDYRTIKSIVLGVNYNMKVWKLANDLWTRIGVKLHSNWNRHLELTQELYDKYMRMFPRLKRYIQECAREALDTGKVVMSLGYERRLPIPPEPPRSDREAWKAWNKYVNHVKNEAANCKAQHLASLITGSAMLDVEERLLDKYNLKYVDYHYMLMTQKWMELNMPLLVNEVHDDLVYDTPRIHRKRNLMLIKETMESLPTLRRLMPELPDIIRIDQKMGPSWGKYLK